MNLFILYFESANYCGYGHHAVVRALDEQEAWDKAVPFMEEYFQEQDQDQYIEENGDDEGVVWSNMISCEPLDKNHEDWKFVVKPDQASFYEFIGVTQEELLNV
jgi:hypothetical protein